MSDTNLSSFIWSVADLLRGDYKQSEYGKVILPFTVLRRLDCVLEATKADVLTELKKRTKAGVNPEPFLLRKAGQFFYNTSPLDLKKLMGDQDHIGENLRAYMQAFSPAVRDIFESFEFHTQIDKLAKSGLLYLVTEKFANIDLHPAAVSNAQMGAVFEELIRKFAELSNETAGEHFTPRDAIRLMVNLLFIEDDEALTKPGVVRSLYDCTAGTGGMLSVAEEPCALRQSHKQQSSSLSRVLPQSRCSAIQRVAVPDGAEGLRTKVQTGDILFSITAYLGSVAVVPDALESAYVSQHVALARLRHSRLVSKWVGYVALSVVGQTWFETQSYGGTKIQLSLDDVRDLPIPVPPVAEQHTIVAYLENELASFDTLTAEAQRAIDLLQERRTALISAAVTGQIDVRGAVAV